MQGGVELSTVKERIDNNVRILSDFKKLSKPGSKRAEYLERLKADLAHYYGYSEFLIDKFMTLFSVQETLALIEKNEAPRPVTIRTNTLKIRRRDLAQILINRGVNLDPVKWSKLGLQIFESQVPIGATPEYLAGYYMLQSTSSFLPVMALDPQEHERILDMCAAPGGKTTHIAQAMKNTGILIANDVNKTRLTSLYANLHRMGVRNAIVSNNDGTKFPGVMGGFDRILLDAPCTGLGVISRDASVKTDKTEEDFKVCAFTQKKLILAAIDSLKDGGVLVYSTCSISVEENEGVVSYALSRRHIKVVDSELPFGVEGFTNIHGIQYHPSVKLGRRFYPHTHNMDGFFICKIIKLSSKTTTKKEDQVEDQVEVQTSNKKKRKGGSESESESSSETPKSKVSKKSQKKKTEEAEKPVKPLKGSKNNKPLKPEAPKPAETPKGESGTESSEGETAQPKTKPANGKPKKPQDKNQKEKKQKPSKASPKKASPQKASKKSPKKSGEKKETPQKKRKTASD